MELRTDDFDYTLPKELIAQHPKEPRASSRLLILDRSNGSIRHETFECLPKHLHPGDVMVANRSRVIPARLHGIKESGGKVELLLLREIGHHRWLSLARPGRKLRAGTLLSFPQSSLKARFEKQGRDGEWEIAFEGRGVDSELHRVGEVPLPAYIHAKMADPERYQTIYGDREGSVAAPTAGLHFTDELLGRIRDRGVAIEYVTLHVGAATFRPVTSHRVIDHRMHSEWGEVPESVARAVNSARNRGSRVVAVGTTSTRLLESSWGDGEIRAFSGETQKFIYPGFTFRAIDRLITNFHLPKSTLLMLVSAFAGRELVLAAYAEAIKERYRFYSFGDAMLIS